MPDGSMMGTMGFMMFFWVIVLLLLVAGTVVGVVLLVRALTGSSSGGDVSSRARSILEERFAKGEIDREEFEERRRVLDV